MNNHWKLSIDTGGTFTDCIAESPAGEISFFKVQSNGVLSAIITSSQSDTSCTLEENWGITQSILSGYQVTFAGNNRLVKVKNYDPENHLLILDRPVNLKARDVVNISANEEAPILIARIATNTPLKGVFPPLAMRLGTTRGTNALLEEKGAKIACCVTKGFKDLLTIGTQQRPDIFALHIIKPAPLASFMFEIDERINADGQVIKTLNDDEIDQFIKQLRSHNIEAVAISLLNSYKNPAHEETLHRKLHEAGFSFISVSSRLSPAINYLRRTETVVVDAYLSPIMTTYLDKISSTINQETIKVLNSGGALSSKEQFKAKDSLLSGPAGGVIGAGKAASDAGMNLVLSLDMGGTSTDVSRIDGKPDFSYELTIGNAHLLTQAINIHTVAAGGGSICGFDGYTATVGPSSAGSNPGPACYNSGGPLTITDVNLLCGRIDPASFGIPLATNKAESAFSKTYAQVSGGNRTITKDELLLGYLMIANQKITNAIRKISVSKGFDPREYSLIGFGGAAGQHLCDIAEMLDMDTILVPNHGSLLSAIGISQAQVKKVVSRQVLAPLKNKELLISAISELKQEALVLINQDNITEPVIESIVIMMRLVGQDATLEIDYHAYEELASSFENQYKKLFGHWVDREIEIESVKVIASEKEDKSSPEAREVKSSVPSHSKEQLTLFQGGWLNTPVFDWSQLKSNSSISGPALINAPFTVVVVSPSWQFNIQEGQAILSKISPGTRKKEEQVSAAISSELFANRYKSVADQMGMILQRTALSVNIKERLDFSCAILDCNGYLVVNAPHIPVHLGSLGVCTRAVIKYLPLTKGDVAITNHPAYGGSHLPDITLIAPVYTKNTLVGYVANRAHHAELGGKTPGSMPADAKNLIEEGVVISPALLVKNGEIQLDIIPKILTEGPYPTRAVKENIADLQAALASINTGQDQLIELCNRYGINQITKQMNFLFNRASGQLISRLNSMKIKSYSATEYLDDGSKLQVTIKIDHGITIDFTGTSGVHTGNLNATEAIVNGVVIYVIKLLINTDIPLNEGLMKPVKLILPECLLNPRFSDDPAACPAVVGGNTEVSQRLVDTLIKAFGLAACSQGTMNNFLFGNEQTGYYETIAGGTGAGDSFDGADAIHQHMTNTKITDPEILEHRYPITLNEFSIRKNSGGTGKWNGGNGIKRSLTFLEPVTCTLLSQHREVAPYGLEGGSDGKVGNQFMLSSEGKRIELSGIVSFKVNAGDTVVIETPGGGGFGNPTE